VLQKSSIRVVAEELTYGAESQTIKVRATGDSGFTSYPTGPRNNPSGQISLMHPLANVVLTHGKNFIGITDYSEFGDFIARGRSYILYLNYHSTVAPQGIWAHNKTTLALLMNMLYIEFSWANYASFCPLGDAEQPGYFINDASVMVQDTGIVEQPLILTATIFSDTTQHYGLQSNVEHAGPVKFLATEYTSVSWVPVMDWFSQVSDGSKPLSGASARLRPYIGNGYGIVASRSSLKSLVGIMTTHAVMTTVAGQAFRFPTAPTEVFVVSTDINDLGCTLKQATPRDDGTYSVQWPEDSADLYFVAHYNITRFGTSPRNKATA
jgi:hypothetical protein